MNAKLKSAQARRSVRFCERVDLGLSDGSMLRATFASTERLVRVSLLVGEGLRKRLELLVDPTSPGDVRHLRETFRLAGGASLEAIRRCLLNVRFCAGSKYWRT